LNRKQIGSLRNRMAILRMIVTPRASGPRMRSSLIRLLSIYPPSPEYLDFLRDAEGIRSALNMDTRPWPDHWIAQSGLDYLHVPVVDMSVPTEEQVLDALDFIDKGLIKGAVMIHCIAGIGRTGTMMGLYLVDNGMDPESAIHLIRDRRKGSIQTTAQEMMIHSWEKRIGGDLK
ncbi:MAG: dual specificity protein phosphatase family protein, partial [Thermoplasmatota archaeon]